MTDTSRTKEKKKEIEILFQYQGHRSIVKCKRSKILENIEKSLVDLVGLPQSSASPETAIKVHTLQSSRRVRGKPAGKKYYLLQRYVKDWSAFINVDSIEQVRNRDTLTIARTVALNSTNESKTESAEESGDRKVYLLI